jgi:hypothetical protein
VQWGVVLERVWAAVWAWYKFVGFGGGGHIVVGRTTQLVFYVSSVLLAVLAYFLSEAELGDKGSRIWHCVARTTWLAVAACVVLWTLVLISPLAVFERKA